MKEKREKKIERKTGCIHPAGLVGDYDGLVSLSLSTPDRERERLLLQALRQQQTQDPVRPFMFSLLHHN